MRGGAAVRGLSRRGKVRGTRTEARPAGPGDVTGRSGGSPGRAGVRGAAVAAAATQNKFI